MAKQELKFVKQVEQLPRCPHCEQELSEIHLRAVGAGFVVASHAVYSCPHCRKVLGVGSSRMI